MQSNRSSGKGDQDYFTGQAESMLILQNKCVWGFLFFLLYGGIFHLPFKMEVKL